MLQEAFERFQSAYDIYSGRYTCAVAEGAEREACFALRSAIFGGELRRGAGEHGSPASVDDYDASSKVIACRDVRADEVVGTIRLTPAAAFLASPEHVREYHLELFPPALRSRVVIASRLVMRKEWRRSPATLQLLAACYAEGFDDGAAICAIVCEPNLLPLYRRLGCRPLSRVFVSAYGGYRLPLFLAVHDYDYLRRVGSPFLRHAKKRGLPVDTAALDWLRDQARERPPIVAGFTLVPKEEADSFHVPLTRGVSPEGQEQLLSGAVRVECQAGDVILEKDAGGRNFGFILRGALEVRDADRCLAVLAEGDVFGEVAYVLDIPRTAAVVAAVPGAEVVLVSGRAFDRVTDPGDREAIWRNLAAILAVRLVSKKED